MKTITLLLIVTACFISSISWGRFQKPEEASHKFLQINQYYRIDKIAQYKSVSEFEVQILNETGRKEFGFYKFNYAPYLTKITDIEAYTKNGDVISKVEKEFIEDKPVASSKDGFDNDNQISVAFPNVQVGSILYFKVNYETHTLSLDNFFSTIEYFGWRENSIKQNIYFESEKELFFHISDPLDSLDLEVKKEKGKFFLNITQKKPIFLNPIEERDAYLSRRSVPHVEVSTEKNWSKDLLKPLIDSYEKVLNEPLPEPFQKIYLQAQNIKDDTQKFEFIMEQLQNHIRYLGDWRTVKGALIPRTLATIAKTAYGDCKDYSASLASILRKSGYKSTVAFVYRGETGQVEKTKLPSLRVSNHAITYVEVSGKPRWLDATNNMVFTAEPLPDIAGRPALVLDSLNPKEQDIPGTQAQLNKSLIQIEFSDIKKPNVTVKAKLKFAGVPASEWTGDQLRSSEEALQFRLLEWTASNVKAVRNAKFQPFSLVSRITKDLEFNYEFQELNPFYTSNQGLGFLTWENSSLMQIAERLDMRSTDLGLNYPRVSEYSITFKNVTSQDVSKLNCSFRSEWVEFDRQVTQKSKTIQINDKTTVLKPRVLREDFESKAMIELTAKIRKCVIHKLLILK